MTYKPPVPLYVSKAGVEAFADKVARKYMFEIGGKLSQLVADLGGNIQTGITGTEDIDSGSMIAKSMRSFTIYLSPFTSIERDRFTVAHELGHLFLHLPKVQSLHPGAVMRATRYVDSNDDSQKRAEWEANWFAAALLMPKDSFIKEYRLGPDSAARCFRVSRAAINNRAKSLKLVGE